MRRKMVEDQTVKLHSFLESEAFRQAARTHGLSANEMKELKGRLVGANKLDRPLNAGQDDVTDAPFLKCQEEAELIRRDLDKWVGKIEMKPRLDLDDQFPLSLLFLGGCSGEWAARTKIRGQLPSFGGFLINAAGSLILVDPGRDTFRTLITQGIHPAYLDMIIVTHSHWDCVRDLGLIIMAASEINLPDMRRDLKLYAEESVIFGQPMNAQMVEEKTLKTIDTREDSQHEEWERICKKLNEVKFMVPGALNAFELFFRLRGRFYALKIGEQIKLAENIDLYIRRSHHRISYELGGIPALDLVVKNNQNKPLARCVYLSDTEYRPDLAEQYANPELGPIDLLICNVKTLSVRPYPKEHKLHGYTQQHLGWNGLVKLTHDMQAQKLLNKTSKVVMRAWGIETVTVLAEDEMLVAKPEKLEIYEAKFKELTKQDCLIPGTTWVKVPAKPSLSIEINHMQPAFYSVQEGRQFGKIYYCSEVMEKLVTEAKAVTGNDFGTVLIVGESGTGKDALANSIHYEAVKRNTRQDRLFRQPASLLAKDLAYSMLMGTTKGAYTGAAEADRLGCFEMAQGGTLIIEDITGLDRRVQENFLSVLQNRKYRRMGDYKEFDLTSQIIGTTNENLQEVLKTGQFRPDLFARFATKILTVPPLRERLEDIPYILEGWHRYNEIKFEKLSRELIKLLQRYSWPLNVRQLQGVITEVATMGDWSIEKVRSLIEKSHGYHEKLIKSFDKEPSSEISKETLTDRIDDAGQNAKHILSLIDKNGRMTRQEIQKSTGLPKSTVNYALNQIIELHLVRRVGKGPYTTYQATKKNG